MSDKSAGPRDDVPKSQFILFITVFALSAHVPIEHKKVRCLLIDRKTKKRRMF